MNEIELRLECLRLSSRAGRPTAEAIAMAMDYEAYLRGKFSSKDSEIPTVKITTSHEADPLS